MIPAYMSNKVQRKIPKVQKLLQMSLELQKEINSLNDEILFDINHELRGVHANLTGLLNLKDFVPPPDSSMEPITEIEFDMALRAVNIRLGKIIEKLQDKY